ncbi:DNA/RNA helicase domain-containing protein [Metallosphaera javensis (ex Sakai et al. 2022)]|uniref:DNA/RNA helicase domain-containing protein n=1 Tax=Metallosphaera javensis (ex Sakai et al. 2022) TaxID=2775498 RepID=UPI002588996D|nr:MAG: ATP-binding protein [Metallosphaera javensis (ex Sakai et al. 2022)]
MTLPLVERPDSITVDMLENAYLSTFTERPGLEQVNAWKSSLEFLRNSGIKTPVIVEMPILGGERADFVFVDDQRGLVVEMKGWKNVRVLDDYLVKADGGIHLNPCYQVENYVNKLNYFHSSNVRFEGTVVMYNARDVELECDVITEPRELRDAVNSLGPVNQEALDRVLRGKFHITDALVSLLESQGSSILQNASRALLSRGYGLTEEQALLVHQVMEDLDNNRDRTYLVRGESGSGKTLVAITLLIEGLRRGKRTVLAYKNNRLLNTLRMVLGPVSGAVRFYSTGYKDGVGQPRFNEELDLVIFDEAQRMTEDVIKTSMTRGKVRVFFYDDNQILIGEEVGTRDMFRRYASSSAFTEMSLSSPFRQSKEYLFWVRELLWGKPVMARNLGIEIRVFNSITDMLRELNNREDRALVCAFTESEGDQKNPDSLKNVRIGFPLQSGFSLYRNVDLRNVVGRDRITWLMDPKKDYPLYWTRRSDLSRCASVYGAQGFEASYVGVVWGRDLVWRGGWSIDPGPITDDVGGRHSLKRLASRDPKRALELLKNRYYIMLTRGIKGVYIFPEDRETGVFLNSLLT